MTTADGNDLGAPPEEALRVNGIDQTLIRVPVRCYNRNDRLIQLPYRKKDQADGTRHEHCASDVTRDELESHPVHEPGQPKALSVQLANHVPEAKRHYGHADNYQGKPTLDVHAGIEPLEEVERKDAAHNPTL